MLRKRVNNHPDQNYLKLNAILLQYGGKVVVPRPSERPDQWLPLVIEFGELIGLPPLKKKGDPSNCHQNVSRIWIAKRYGIKAIGVGFGMNLDDGVWHEHTFGISARRILETTCLRDKYFGFSLHGELADLFAKIMLRPYEGLAGPAREAAAAGREGASSE